MPPTNQVEVVKTIDEEITSALEKDQLPSNIDNAKSPDGFKATDPKHPLEGFQILQPASGRETAPPEQNSINPAWVEDEKDHWNPADLSKKPGDITREDLENPQDTEDSSIELSSNPDVSWEDLKERYIALGFPEEEFPDDVIGTPEESIILDLLQKEIVNAEFGKFEMSVIRPDIDGKQHEVEFRVNRIENPALRTKLNSLIERHGENYIPDIWENATEVDFYKNKENIDMIMVKGKKENEFQPFIVMSFTDFSRMLSVPSIKEGNSRIDFPPIDPNIAKDKYKIISVLTKIRHNGKPIGGKDFKNYIFR